MFCSHARQFRKTTKAIFVGYPLGTKGYKLYDLSSKHFSRSRNVLFYKHKFRDFEFNDEKVVFRKIYGSDFGGIEQPISSVKVEPMLSHMNKTLCDWLRT